MKEWITLEKARKILNGQFIESRVTRGMNSSLVRVLFPASVLEEARTRNFFLTYVPDGSLHELGRDMLMFMRGGFRGEYIEGQEDACWCLLKVSDGHGSMPLCGYEVSLLPVRETVYASFVYMHQNYLSLFRGKALTAFQPTRDPEVPRKEVVLEQEPGAISLLEPDGSQQPSYSNRIVGLRRRSL